MSTYPSTTYPSNLQRTGVVSQYQPQATDNHGYPSSQGALMQNSTNFQSYTNSSQGTYSPYTPQQNLMTHSHPTQDFQVADIKAGAPAPKLDPGATPRLESALRCLYATLSFSIPLYILQITTLFDPLGSFWIAPIALMFTLIFSSTVVMVTFRDRARMHPNSTKAPPTLPAICRLPTIISCFLIVVLWIVALGLMIFTMVVLGGSLYLGYEYSSSSFYGAVATIATIIGSVEAICVVAQIGLLLAVGILGAVERKHAKRYIKGATMA